MGIQIGDNNKFKNVTIAEKMNGKVGTEEDNKKTFAEKHPVLIGLFCSFVVGVLLLFNLERDNRLYRGSVLERNSYGKKSYNKRISKW